MPQSEHTDVASGGERARLGSSGRGEGLDALGGANEDNQNAMREAQILNPAIAGAEGGVSDQTKVSSQNVEEVIEAGEFDQGLAESEDLLLSRIGDDEENKDIGDPNALIFEENEDKAVLQASVDTRLILSLNAIALLVLGITPGWLLSYCYSVFN